MFLNMCIFTFVLFISVLEPKRTNLKLYATVKICFLQVSELCLKITPASGNSPFIKQEKFGWQV